MRLKFWLFLWETRGYRDYCDSIVSLLVDFVRGHEDCYGDDDIYQGMRW